MDIIELTISFPFPGAIGETNSDSISLLRPLRQVAKGHPVGDIACILFQQGTTVYHFGALCYSPGLRLLFFPGLTHRTMKWGYARGQNISIPDPNIVVDHITLDKGFIRGHVTSTPSDGKIYRQKYKTLVVHGDALFWFAISVKSPNLLESVYSRVKFTFSSPCRDAERRRQEVQQVGDHAAYSLVSLPENARIGTDEFLHFQFFLTESDFASVGQNCLILPDSPAVHGHQYRVQNLVRIHPVTVHGLHKKMWLVVSKHTGALASDAIITTR